MKPSRLFSIAALAAFALVPGPAQAQARRGELPIPLPPGATVQIEVDGRDNDLLGMVKDLIGGVQFGPGAAALTGTAATGTAVVVTRPGPPALLSDMQLASLLQNIHHLHLVSFAPPAPSGKTLSGNTRNSPFDGLAFYDKPLQSMGGHRTLFYGNGPRVALYGFDQTHAFAAVVDTGGVIYALRADGSPDMAVLGKIIHFGLGHSMGNEAASAAATPAPAKP